MTVAQSTSRGCHLFQRSDADVGRLAACPAYRRHKAATAICQRKTNYFQGVLRRQDAFRVSAGRGVGESCTSASCATWQLWSWPDAGSLPLMRSLSECLPLASHKCLRMWQAVHPFWRRCSISDIHPPSTWTRAPSAHTQVDRANSCTLPNTPCRPSYDTTRCVSPH